MLVELVVKSALGELTGMLPAYVTYGLLLCMPVDLINSMHLVQAA